MQPLTVARRPESRFSNSLRTNRGMDEMVLLLIVVVTGKQQRLNGVTKLYSVLVVLKNDFNARKHLYYLPPATTGEIQTIIDCSHYCTKH